jgi:hypothetical protein
MRRRLSIALVAGLALALPAVAQAQKVRITVMSYVTLQQVKDSPPLKKTNAGDAVEYKDLLVNVKAQFGKKAGKPVAYDDGIITYKGKSKPQVIYGVATFPGIGTLIYRGAMMDAGHGSTVVKVTGGTGGFKGARGTLTLGPGTQKSLNTYRVTIPHGNVAVNGSGGGVA